MPVERLRGVGQQLSLSTPDRRAGFVHERAETDLELSPSRMGFDARRAVMIAIAADCVMTVSVNAGRLSLWRNAHIGRCAMHVA